MYVQYGAISGFGRNREDINNSILILFKTFLPAVIMKLQQVFSIMSTTTTLLLFVSLLRLWSFPRRVSGFVPVVRPCAGKHPLAFDVRHDVRPTSRRVALLVVGSSMEGKDETLETAATTTTTNSSSSAPMELFASEEEKNEAVGNLVADDEWMGLTMELSELVRLAVVEDLKKNARDFLGKDDYKIGDISKEIDTRVKDGGTCQKRSNTRRRVGWIETHELVLPTRHIHTHMPVVIFCAQSHRCVERRTTNWVILYWPWTKWPKI